MVMFQVTICPPEWHPIMQQEMRRGWVSQNDLLSDARTQDIVRTRHAIWRRLNDELGIAPYRISREMGFDHTTVLNALGRLGRNKRAA